MVCRVCGDPATGMCRQCNRYACNEHIDETFQGVVCTVCGTKTRGQQKRDEEELRKETERRKKQGEKERSEWDEHSKCAFCGLKGQKHACDICKRFFCEKHGTFDIESTRDYDGGERLVRSDIRCKDHRRRFLGIF